MKDGWHKIYGYDVYIENNIVIRGTKANGTLPAYVYRACRAGGWDRDNSVTVNAFRAGVRRGTIKMS